MKGWLDSNQKKRKTKRGILRFVNAWLSREQDKGRRYEPNEKKRKFNNFDQRNYNYSDLERRIFETENRNNGLEGNS